jgi:hypothetical protein
MTMKKTTVYRGEMRLQNNLKSSHKDFLSLIGSKKNKQREGLHGEDGVRLTIGRRAELLSFRMLFLLYERT